MSFLPYSVVLLDGMITTGQILCLKEHIIYVYLCAVARCIVDIGIDIHHILSTYLLSYFICYLISCLLLTCSDLLIAWACLYFLHSSEVSAKCPCQMTCS